MVSTRRKEYSFIASTTRTSQKSLLEEVAKVGASFDVRNEAVILTEGELPMGNLPAIPRIRTSDLDEFLIKQEESEDDEEIFRAGLPISGDPECHSGNAASLEYADLDSAVYELRSKGSVDWENPEGDFIVPKFTAKKKYKDWLEEQGDLQRAIEASVAEGQKKASQAAPDSMAVIVEVPDKSKGKKEDSKGKNIAAGERSDGFAAYLKEMCKEATGSNKKAPAEKKKTKEKFSRAESQLPHSGWFRATTSKSGSPPAPLNTPSDPSDSSSSLSSSSSLDSDSDEPGSSSDSDSSSSSSDGGTRHKKLGKKTVRDFIHNIRSLAKRFPDVTEQHLVQIFWDRVEPYIHIKWLDRGMGPEDSSLDKLAKWAMRFKQ
ncbi:hypothetical protein K438DRAFT_1765191 [Mycena galopus ATCC 62051]|nr:hypothetical protein K438DRAFT_1765191 [Mycena galopus ATCC 62051]